MVHAAGHAAKSLDKELGALISGIREMGGKVEQQLEIARKALIAPAPAQMEQAKALDKEINALEEKIDSETMILLSRHHPMMAELRFVTFSVKLVMLLERTGDLAKNTVRRLSKMGAPVESGMRADLDSMALVAIEMLARNLHMLEEFSAEDARALVKKDDMIDGLYKKLKKEIRGGSAELAVLNHLQMIAQNLERIADNATDMSRILYFIHTGDRLAKA